MEPGPESTNGFAMAVMVEGGLALAAAFLAWLFSISLRDQFPPPGKPLAMALARGVIATLPMLVVFWLLVNSRRPALRPLRDQVDWVVREMFPSRSILQFAMVATLAGVGEEILFRGVLQTKIGEWTTPVIALIVASVFFGFAHALSKLYFAFAVVVGAFLGWLSLEFHDLVAPIVAHGLYDFLALVYLSKAGLAPIAKLDAPPHDEPSDR